MERKSATGKPEFPENRNHSRKLEPCRVDMARRKRQSARFKYLPRAQMAELVDAPASGAGIRKDVEVRVLFWAPYRRPLTSIKVRQHSGFMG